MVDGILEILYLCIAGLAIFALAVVCVGIMYLYEEGVKFYAFRTFDLFEQHWGGL